MKLVTFEVPTPLGPVSRLGGLLPGKIVDLNAAAYLRRLRGEPEAAARRLADALVPPDMIGFLDMEDAGLAEARLALRFAADALKNKPKDLIGPKGELAVHKEWAVRLRAPVPRPRALRDFFAFEEHALQGAARRNEPLAPQWYEQPVYYKGNHREIYGPDDLVPWPSYTRRLDFELELGAVVGRKGRDLSPVEAGKHIVGYTILNDFSARDIQKSEMVCRMGPAKGKDFGTALGPYLATPDELGDIDDLAMAIFVNGEKWSTGRSSGRYWSFATMLSHVSQEETVYPGDVLGSGTYYRGCGLDLDRWLKPGDVVELEIGGLGRLRNKVGRPAAQKQLKYPRAKAAA